MQRFLPPVSPTKVKMLEPWKDMQDDIIEIPDGAGLSDHTRNDLVELWTSGDDIGIHDPYTPVYTTPPPPPPKKTLLPLPPPPLFSKKNKHDNPHHILTLFL